MNEVLITDLVSQQALDQLENLDRAMEGTLTQFQDCARELARGIKIPVEVTGDLDRLQQLYNTQMRNAQQATQQLTQQLQQQQQVVANTTNTISRQLMEQEKLNKANREAFTQNQEALRIAEQIVGTYEENTRQLARYTAELARNKAQLKEVENQRKSGLITDAQALQRSADLMAEQNKLKAAMQEVASVVRAQAKEMNAAEGSYVQLSQQLEILKKAQKGLNEEEKAGAEGKMLEKEIQNLDARLKDLAADMGEFQRNVGNYAIAAQNMKGTLRELTEEIAQLTLQYEELSDEDKRGDIGNQLRDKITQLTEEAGKYKDIVSDVKESIKGSASDTRLFDTLTESGKMLASTFGLCSSAAQALGISNDSLQQSMLKVQSAMQAVQALTVLQTATQKQSNIMKGIAILQSKAAAAAARIEASATATATGATKAQTVAQAAFNIVAKANPYVLLATAILAVIGLIVGYTAATKDATKADEEAKKAADERKESMENMAQSFGNAAGELIAKYKLLREQWNALGDDIAAKRQFLVQHKSDFDAIADAAYGAGSKIKDVNGAEKLIHDNTAKVEAAIKRRAMAMAAYAEYIRITQLQLQELEKLSTYTYHVYKAGDRVSRSEFAKAGLTMNEDQKQAARYSGYGNGISDSTTWLTAEQAAQMTNYAKQQGNQAALDAIEAANKKYDAMRERAWNRFVQSGGLEPANFAGGGGGSTTSGKGGGKGGGGKNTDKVKSAEEIQRAVDAILLEGYKRAVDMEEEYTDEWLEKEKERIQKQRDHDIAAAEKKRDDLKADILASKLSEEEKKNKIIDITNATQDIVDGIKHNATEEEKKAEEEVTNHKEEEAKKQVDIIADAAAGEQAIRDLKYQDTITKLYNEYNEAIKTAVKKGEDTTKVEEEFNRKKLEEDNKYANETVQAQIKALEEEVAISGLSAEERERIRKELAEATAQLAQQQAEQEKAAMDDVVAKDKEAKDKRNQNLQMWVQKAGEAIDKISGLITAMYDSQIAKIEELLEAEQEQYEREVEHIEYLAERGAITSEEAEIRKRDAAAATAKKQEELEKRKAALEYKKAVTEKVNSVSQAAISTALGIMSALAQFPGPVGWALAAAVGAMGAIQIATILAQPIKAYKEGTKGKPHPGGLALVGEGGRQELVVYDGKAWVTPDTPTLIDLPRGAEVLPDADKAGTFGPVGVTPRDRATGAPIIINDYTALESRVAANTKAVTKTLDRFSDRITRQMKRQKFNAYIASRI